MARPNRCRSPRSAAARFWAKPGMPPTREWAYASAGPSRGSTPGSSEIRDDPIPTWSDDLLVPDGEIGEIVVAGPVVTREYFNRPEATSLAKIADPARQAFYHRMGDLGYRDSQGRLWFCGRKSHRVILAQETLFTIPCESIFNAHPAVARSALVGVRRQGQVVPVICVEPLGAMSRSEQRPRQARIARARRGVSSHLEDQDDSLSSILSRRYSPQRQDLPRKAGRLGLEEAVMKPADLGQVLVTGGGGFLGTALIKLLVAARACGPQPEPAALPPFARAGGRTSPGRHRRPAGRDPRRRGLPDRLPHRGQGGHLGPGRRVRADQRPGHSQRDRGLPGSWLAADHLQQLAQRGLQRPGHGRRRRVGPLLGTIRGRLPRDQGPSRADHPRVQHGEPGHDLDSPALDLGPGRQQSAAADPRPGPARAAPAHRPGATR